VPVALLLVMASWLRGRVLALLTSGRRRRVAATSGLVAQRFQYPAGYRNYPPLSGALRCTSFGGARLLCLLRATCVFVWHFFYGKLRVETNWRMGVYAPPRREIYLRSPALLFLCHIHPAIHANSVNGSQRRSLTGPQCDLPQGQWRSGQGY